MSKRSVFTTITPLPSSVSRQTVIDFFHDHVAMIDLNPLVEKREKCKAPKAAAADEFHATWYQITDKVAYVPTKVVYYACFHDLPGGLQTHCLAGLGVDIRAKWSIGGSLQGEPREPMELGLGIPKEGLYLREDTDLRCNILLTSFVKKNLKNAHSVLVARLVERVHLTDTERYNTAITGNPTGQISSPMSGMVPSVPALSPSNPYAVTSPGQTTTPYPQYQQLPNGQLVPVQYPQHQATVAYPHELAEAPPGYGSQPFLKPDAALHATPNDQPGALPGKQSHFELE